MSDAMIGHGVQVQRSSDGTSGGTFSTVGTMYDVGLPGVKRGTVDVTSHESVERWREFIGALKEMTEFSVDLQFDPGDAATTTACLNDVNTDTAGYYKIVFPDDGSTDWGFGALVTGFDPTMPLEGKATASVSFQPSGKPGYIA